MKLARKPLAKFDDPPGFNSFWATYPLAEDKGDARKVWTSMNLEAIADVVVMGARRYRDDPNRKDGYTKKPKNWLQGECWENGPLPFRGNANGTNKPTPAEQFMQTVAIGQRMAAEDRAPAVNGFHSPAPRALRAVPADDDQYELPDVWTGSAR